MPRKSRKPPSGSAQTDTEKKEKEDPRVTFVRLGEARLTSAIKRIVLLKNVARYPHTPRQSEKVMAAIEEAVESLRNSFAGKKEVSSKVNLAEE